jgi:branched-chain amino acid transport system permease protein
VKKFNSLWLRGLGLGLLLAVICVLPFVVRPFQLEILIFLFINIILVVSFRLIAITGEFSLVHAVLMGVGAYASALLTKWLGISPWITLPLGGLAAATLAFILSFPLFRMKGLYFLIGSFAAGEAIRQCWERFRGVFGGSKGISGIPSFEIGGINLAMPVPFYFFAVVMMLICLAIMYRIEKSRFGFFLDAIHWQDTLCQSVGINARRHRVLVFVIASFFAGIAGTMFAHYLSAVSPHDFGLGLTLSVLVWVIVGGIGTFAGPIIGVTLLSIVDESIRSVGEYRPLIYGIILILTMLLLPEGLQALPAKVVSWIGRFWQGAGRQTAQAGRSRAAAPSDRAPPSDS